MKKVQKGKFYSYYNKFIYILVFVNFAYNKNDWCS